METTTTPEEPDGDLRAVMGEAVLALRELTTSNQAVIGRLDLVADSNDNLRTWRRRATVAITAVAILFAGFVWETRADGQARDRDAAAELAEDVRETEALRVAGCRLRNAYQHDTRERFTATYNVLEARGLNPDALADLRATLGSPEEEDADCTRDGVLDSEDYPAQEVPSA